MKFKLALIILGLIMPFIFVGCENKNQQSLSTPNLVAVSNGVVIFEAVENANYYSIQLNELSINVSAKYNANTEIIDGKVHYDASKVFSFETSYTVKVKALAENFVDSSYSNKINYVHDKILEKPKGLIIF